MENRALGVIFSIFVGVLVALLIGFGIVAVDPGPPPPEGMAGDQQMLAYRAAVEAYDREVSLAASGAALVPLIVSALLPRRALVIADGLLLGAVFGLVYGATRGTYTQATAASFAAAAIGLVLALAAGHVRFAGWTLPRRTQPRKATPAAGDRMMMVLLPLASGVLMTLTVALGVQTFYPQPVPPTQLYSPEFDDAMRQWARNLGIIATVIAVLLLVLSLLAERATPVTANTLLLGGLFTLFYGAVPAIGFGQGATAFLVLAVALVVVLFIGYRRFVSRRPRGGAPGAPPPAPPATA